VGNIGEMREGWEWWGEGVKKVNDNQLLINISYYVIIIYYIYNKEKNKNKEKNCLKWPVGSFPIKKRKEFLIS